MANPKLKTVVLKNFLGLNNGVGNEAIADNEALDLQNIRFNKRGNIIKGYGATDLQLGTWPTADKVLGLKFNSTFQKYLCVLDMGDYATFYEYSGTWSVVGYTHGSTVTTATATVTGVASAFTTHVKPGDYFKFNEDDDTHWKLIISVDSATVLTLESDYGHNKTKAYTIRISLGQYNYGVVENPTLADTSYWYSSKEALTKIYKWDEVNAIIYVSAPANQPINPKFGLGFKDRLWVAKGIINWGIASSVTAIWKFNETLSATLPVDSKGSNTATSVTTTAVASDGKLNYCRVGGMYGFSSGRGANNISYINLIAPTGNATDGGDLTNTQSLMGGCSGSCYSFFGGGDKGGVVNIIEYLLLSSATGNAVDKGDLSVARKKLAGVSGYIGSTVTYGFFCGGET